MSEAQNDDLVLDQVELQLERNREEMDMLEVTAATLESIYAEVVNSGKVSRDQVEKTMQVMGLESMNGYPANAFTQYPSKTNLKVAQEGIIGSIADIFVKTIKAIFKFIGDFFVGIWKFMVGLFNLIFRRNSDKPKQAAVANAMIQLDSVPKASFDDRRISDKNAAYKKATEDYFKSYSAFRHDLFTAQTYITQVGDACVAFRGLLKNINDRLDALRGQLEYMNKYGMYQQQHDIMAAEWTTPPPFGIEDTLKHIQPEIYAKAVSKVNNDNENRNTAIINEWVQEYEVYLNNLYKQKTPNSGSIVPAETVFQTLSDQRQPLTQFLLKFELVSFSEEDRKILDRGAKEIKALAELANPKHYRKNDLPQHDGLHTLFVKNLRDIQNHIFAVHGFITKVWAPIEVELTRMVNDTNRVTYAKLNRDISAAKLQAMSNQDTDTLKNLDTIVKSLSGFNAGQMKAVMAAVPKTDIPMMKDVKS